MMRETFPIVPAGGGPVWILVGLAVILLGLTALFGFMVYSSRHVRCEVTPQELRIAGDIYGRRIPMEAISLDGAKVIDLGRDEDYRFKWRTNGTGLPGYSAGWFRLRNGEKALAFVTDRHRVLYLPTRKGYSILLSVVEPDAMLAALQRAGAR
jgi:hypothetical protein